MGIFRRKQRDRSYSVKLKRADYAKLGLIAQRYELSESDAMGYVIDFALASNANQPKSGLGGLNIASLITGEGEGSDLSDTLIKAFLPQLLSGNNPIAGTPSGPSPGTPNDSSPDADLQKKLRDLGL